MTPRPSLSSDSGTLLCCGLCKIKMIKRNFFRGLFRLSRPQSAVRKTEHEERAGSSRAYHRHGRDALETDLRDRSYLGVSPVSPSVSVTTSQRSQCNVHCRKSSVLSFGDVDTREVHRMMKFINRSKVMLFAAISHEDFLSQPNIFHLQIHMLTFSQDLIFLPSAKLIGEQGDPTQYAQSRLRKSQIDIRRRLKSKLLKTTISPLG